MRWMGSKLLQVDIMNALIYINASLLCFFVSLYVNVAIYFGHCYESNLLGIGYQKLVELDNGPQ